MRITRPLEGKILRQTGGMGVPTSETVRQRALELALIAGREVYTEEDWKQAFMELHGGHPDNNGGEAESEMQESASERDMVAPTLGHHRGIESMEGDESLGEELIAEGLDEAVHDQMVQARRSVDLPDEVELS